MNRGEHVAEAERLLTAAKEVSRRPKESDVDRKNDDTIMLDLLAFANLHCNIARAMQRGWQED